MRAAALVSATGLLVMAVLSPVAYFYIFPRLVDRTSLAHTMQNIVAHQGMFLAGIVAYLITFLADIVVAWALYLFLRPAHASLSMLAAWLRVVYAAMALSALMKLVTVLRLVRDPDYATAFGPEALHAHLQWLLTSFRFDWGFGLLVFAVYLVLLGGIVTAARHVPTWIGVLLIVNGVAYLVDSLRPYLFPGTALPFLPVLFFGELIFMGWLFVLGGRNPEPLDSA